LLYLFAAWFPGGAAISLPCDGSAPDGLALYVTAGSSHLPSQRVSRTGTDQPPPHATPATPEDSAGRSRSPIPSAAAFPDCPPGRRLRL